MIKVSDSGYRMFFRALLDQGPQASFISEAKGLKQSAIMHPLP